MNVNAASRSMDVNNVKIQNVRKLPSNSSEDGLTTSEWTDWKDSFPKSDGDAGAHINPTFACDLEDEKEIRPPPNGTWNEKGKCEMTAENADEGKNTGPLQTLKNILCERRSQVGKTFKLILLVLYNIYLGFAVSATWSKASTWCDGVKFLVIFTIIGYIFAFHSYIFKPYLLKWMRPCLLPITTFLKKLSHFKYSSRLIWGMVLGSIGVFLIVDTSNNRYRLVSFTGLIVFIFLGFVFSKHRKEIKWHHLLWGVTLQFLLGLLILRWSVGQDVFSCLGDKIKAFLDITDKGSTFVFGYLVSGEMVGIPQQPAVFAFKVLTVVIFFSFVVSLLYYYGAMQVVVAKVGWLLQVTIGTTACESMNAAGNIFLGMTEAPLLIRPYLPVMTKSELHAVMTGGFATIAGSVLAAYINFGINASHLLTASVMAAPAALAYSKLLYPETEESQTHADNIKMEKGTETNALEAATNGASAAIQLVSNIAANLIAFVAFIALLDAVFAWLGSLLLWDHISFEWLLSKVFIPVSILMGIEWSECELVANLIGLKTVVNEFVAYKRLAEFQEQKLLSARSEAIVTFALCGFSNISSIGIQMGALTAMAPQRKSDLSQIAVRAMIAGTVTCFMNACVAGTLLGY